MIRACLRQPWSLKTTLTAWSPSRRLSTAAAAINAIRPDPFIASLNETKHEDDSLRKVFDSNPFWKTFSHQAGHGTHNIQSSKGLFQNRYLTDPFGFRRFAQDIETQCRKIVDDVLQASSTEQYKQIPKQLDLLSDCLCRVLDIADFVRATHPNDQFRRAADQVYVYLWEYMNTLNTTPGLKEQLKKAISSPGISSSWNIEEMTVARILMKDFSDSAIDLPQEYRRRFVHLSNSMKQLGAQFVEEMEPVKTHIELNSADAKGLNPAILKTYGSNISRNVLLPLTGDAVYSALRSVQNENVRKAIYSHMKSVSQSQIETLEHLLRVRAELAKLSGCQSYAEMNLADKMARNPEAVNTFLKALSADNTFHVARELEQMKALKGSNGENSLVQPWDIFFYQEQVNATATLSQRTRRPDHLAAYFSLGTVMQGLSRLFNRLYGIRLVPHETGAGETWDPKVRRLDVMHEDEGHVAVLYCDLFERQGKSPNPAHFTLRCSREISAAEIADTALVNHDGMARAVSRSTGQLCQLPTIALICDFPHPLDRHSPTMLSFQEVQTVFHEMGHAIHSILGRTSLQGISGTRCPTDFAELPSVLMESFAADKAVLDLFARHWETDAPLPYEMVQEVLDRQKRGQGMHTETQILYSLLDQAYHSSLPLKEGFRSTKTYYDIYDEYGSLREPRGISPQGFFGHLVEYGGTYYSYLFDRAIAGRIWKEVFRGGKDKGGVDRRAGEKFKDEVLKWGGGRNPWACISGVLDDDRLKHGGKEAMEEVGKWGVHY